MTEQFDSPFASDLKPTESHKEALKQAFDIRKFEIDLYWKRGTYFWTFIAASLGAYAYISKEKYDYYIIYIVSNLGLLFTLAWYFVNRGSSAWQRNWETHVDVLEDAAIGPLYKTVYNMRNHKFLNLVGPYAFSPSKINNILGIIILVAWYGLITKDAFSHTSFSSLEKFAVCAAPIFLAFLMFWFGRTASFGRPVKVSREMRKLD